MRKGGVRDPEDELTVYGILFAILIGSLLAAANTYLGLYAGVCVCEREKRD